MSIHLIKTLPSPEEIKAEFPLSKEQIELKKERDAQIRDVFTGAYYNRTVFSRQRRCGS